MKASTKINQTNRQSRKESNARIKFLSNLGLVKKKVGTFLTSKQVIGKVLKTSSFSDNEETYFTSKVKN